jgi:tRNA(Ile)-lysidine synthase TilS/MesJ
MSQIPNNLPDEFIRLAGGEVAFVVNFSGGKDSMRMLARVRELYPRAPNTLSWPTRDLSMCAPYRRWNGHGNW